MYTIFCVKSSVSEDIRSEFANNVRKEFGTNNTAKQVLKA